VAVGERAVPTARDLVARARLERVVRAATPTIVRVPPTPFVAAVLGAWLLAQWGRLRLPFARGLGWLLIVAGLALDGWAIVTQYRAGTSPLPGGKHTVLVTWGPYAWTRNPIYIAHTLVAIGVGLAWTRSAWALLAAAGAWFVTDRVTVPAEETALEGLFGAEYERYRGRVGRWWDRPPGRS